MNSAPLSALESKASPSRHFNDLFRDVIGEVAV